MQRKFASTPGKNQGNTILRPAMPDIAVVSKERYTQLMRRRKMQEKPKLLFSLSPS